MYDIGILSYKNDPITPLFENSSLFLYVGEN